MESLCFSRTVAGDLTGICGEERAEIFTVIDSLRIYPPSEPNLFNLHPCTGVTQQITPQPGLPVEF